MHYIKHNFTDWDFATKHMNRIEKTIFLDLRSDYFCQEKPIDAGKPELLERRLNIQSEEERQALEFVLKDKFTKKDGKYRVLEWDKIIKDYRHQELITATVDMIRRLKQAEINMPINAGTPAIREAYLNQFGADKLTRITKNANANNETANGESDNANAAMTNAERQAKSKAERKFLVEKLRELGEQVTQKTAINDLRNLYNDRFGSDAIEDMGKQTSENANENKANKVNANGKTLTANGANETANGANESENKNANESNERKTAITKNHKPRTINQEPLTKNQESESTHTQSASVNNSVDNIEPSQTIAPQSQQANPIANETNQINKNIPPAFANPNSSGAEASTRQQQVKQIEDWPAPSFVEAKKILEEVEKEMNLTGTEYRMLVEDFKNHYAAEAEKGKALAPRMVPTRFRQWLVDEVNKKATQNARLPARFNIDNEDWSNSRQSAPSNHNSDLPSGFHPSHSQFSDVSKSRPVVASSQDWYWKEPLPGMSIPETEDYIKARRQGGETPKQTYDRVIVELQGEDA